MVASPSAPSLEELRRLGRRFNIPVAEDLGSGWLDGRARRSAGGAARRADRVRQHRAGADVVCFSGDKLLGGRRPASSPAGARRSIDPPHPLMRALRVDKLTYAALEATLEEHAIGRARKACRCSGCCG
jgi:L-seryl-tRNA(Ser) seleniumtransferase